MNSHEITALDPAFWSVFDTDPARASLWWAVNFATGAAYLFVPFDLRPLFKKLSALHGEVGTLCAWFILLCGVSHLVMPFIMPIAPWPVILFPFLPMAAVSVATAVVLRKYGRDLWGR